MKNILKLLRPGQYLKNVFVFAALFFSFSFFNFEKTYMSVLTFIVFSISASGVYILNDIFDIEEDRKHPEKKHRPIACGDVSKGTAYVLLTALMLSSLVASYLINMSFLLIIAAYILINVLYSLELKHISVLDVVMVATGFLLRVLAGGAVTGIYISMWLIIMTFLLALFPGIAKRREDVILNEKGMQTRKNVDGYNLEFINASMVLMAGVIIVSYILYTVSGEVQTKFGTHNLFYTSFFVLVGILRYMQITFVEDNSGNPTNLLYGDRFLQLTIVSWISVFFVIVQFHL
jgi:decaprenyl-phosphate phosphoribosyltransferase